MARNYEKRFTGLNRFLEAKQKESDKAEKHRPSLHKLETAEDVKKWIPSIRREIDCCLQQLAGVESRNYPDYKVKEFQERVQQLEREHKRYVEKVHALDPETRGTIPWQPRPYTRRRKRSHDTHVTTQDADGPQPKMLCSPLLEQETAAVSTNKATCIGYKATSNLQLETKLQPSGGSPSLMTSYTATSNLRLETKPQPSGSSLSLVTSQSRTNTSPQSQLQRLPGLDYSSSEEES